MPESNVEKSFCTTSEAAALLGVSVGTVQLWVESGLLQAWKTSGGHRRVLRESVEKLLHKAPVAASQIDGPSNLLPSFSQAPARQLHVMVVEDDVNLLRLYQSRVTSWALRPRVTLMNNAFEALLAIGRGGPDLLITDLHMPGMDGFRMLKVLRNAPEMLTTRVVVVSGLNQADVHSRGGIPDGVELLAKPIPFDRLSAIALEVAQGKGLIEVAAPQ